jgi:hypothetical protein
MGRFSPKLNKTSPIHYYEEGKKGTKMSQTKENNMPAILERVPCVICGKSTYSRYQVCGNCQQTKCRQCATCGTPIRWQETLCLKCEKVQLIERRI